MSGFSFCPVPRSVEAHGERLPFAGCRSIKAPPGWEASYQPLSDLGEAYGGWTCSIERDESLAPEAYRLTIENAWIRIWASEPRGAFYAVQTLLQTWDQTALTTMTVEDSPSAPLRGVIEGFYGTPWSHQARLGMIDFIGARKMNLFLYAPKDDPYHRELWREPYPDQEFQQLTELIERARANYIDFCFCISPGLSMVYSDQTEFDLLKAKIKAIMAQGVRRFGLLVDDIPEELQHDADKAAYGSLAAAHADLANRLWQWLKNEEGESWLSVCPTFYHNVGEPPYVKELGQLTDPAISIMWTGRKVVPREIAPEEAESFGASIRRKPLVWENYPVNDYETSKLLMAPYDGRSPETLKRLEGLFSNPMNQAEASKLAVGAMADCLWNTEAYDPIESRRTSAMHLVGADALKPFLSFCDANQWTRHWTNDPPPIAKLVEEWQITADLEPIRAELDRIERECAHLRQSCKNVALMEEIEPWLFKLEELCAVGLRAVRMAGDGTLSRNWIQSGLDQLRHQEPIVLNGWIERWLDELSAGFVR